VTGALAPFSYLVIKYFASLFITVTFTAVKRFKEEGSGDCVTEAAKSDHRPISYRFRIIFRLSQSMAPRLALN
jgi:hypothetical protein